MKKIVIALAAILVNAIFAPSASALPVFARQTGFACNQCHFQHYPMLNAFGRSFKAGGFTMIGAQPKVEGDGLSMPDRLNLGVLTTLGIEKVSNGGGLSTDGVTPVDDSVNTPAGGGELSLFFGGRISENAGFLAEMGTAGTAGVTAAKLPMFYDIAEGTHAGLVFVTTDGQGAAHSYETMNTGASAVHKLMNIPGQVNQYVRAFSAAQYLNTATAAQGASFVVNNDNYFVNVGKYAIPAAMGASTKGGSMRMTYMRAAAMFDVAGFDSGVGVQAFRGDDGVLAVATGTEATMVDGQMQGQVGTMPLGVYVSYGVAPVVNFTDAVGNHFNMGGVVDAKSLNIAAEVGVVPGIVTLMASCRAANDGRVSAANENLTDNAVMVGLTYTLAMNMQISLAYTAQSGTAWDAANNVGGVEPAGKTTTALAMMVLF